MNTTSCIHATLIKNKLAPIALTVSIHKTFASELFVTRFHFLVHLAYQVMKTCSGLAQDRNACFDFF